MSMSEKITSRKIVELLRLHRHSNAHGAIGKILESIQEEESKIQP